MPAAAGGAAPGSGQGTKAALPLQYWQYSIAATVSHVAAHSFTSPLAVMQVSSQVGVHRAASGTLRGALRASYATMRSQGNRAMFKGNLASCLRALPFNKTQALLYANAQLVWGDPMTSKLDTKHAFAAGVSAAGVATLLMYPLDTVQTRLVVQDIRPGRRAYKHIRNCFATMVRYEGVRSLYRGVTPALLAWLPFTAAGFLCQEVIGFMWEYGDREALSHEQRRFLSFLASASSLTFARFVSYPLDTVKRMMQAQSRPLKASIPNIVRPDVAFTNSLSCAQAIIREHGFMSLWRGGLSMLCRIMPFTAIMTVSYGLCQEVFEARNNAHTVIIPRKRD